MRVDHSSFDRIDLHYYFSADAERLHQWSSSSFFGTRSLRSRSPVRRYKKRSNIYSARKRETYVGLSVFVLADGTTDLFAVVGVMDSFCGCPDSCIADDSP